MAEDDPLSALHRLARQAIDDKHRARVTLVHGRTLLEAIELYSNSDRNPLYWPLLSERADAFRAALAWTEESTNVE